MFITPSLKKSLIVEQFQGNYLNVLTSLSLGQYIKASVWDFPVITSLSYVTHQEP